MQFYSHGHRIKRIQKHLPDKCKHGEKSIKELRLQLMGNRRANVRNDEDTVRDYADCDMEMPRLLAVLLMVLEWTRPGLPSPLRPICDPRVLDRFIKEARDSEATMRGCREGCSLVEPLAVPLTSVDFAVWEKKDFGEQAREVQTGLWLLGQAMGTVRASVTNTAMNSVIDTSYRNIHSIGQVLHRLNIQEYTPSASAAVGEDTWRVSTVSELFRVQTNFLRGKVRLLLSAAPACNQNSS